MKWVPTLLGALASSLALLAQPSLPSKLITATVTPSGPIAVGQTVTVTLRISLYSGPAADGFGVLVNYDRHFLSFVPDSFYLGDSNGPNQQWLTMPDQESAAEGYVPQHYCDGSVPGSVLVSLGDVGRSFPRRGVTTGGGFLASFQLIAIEPGTSSIQPTNYAGIALYDTTHQPIPGVTFSGTSILVRKTDIIPMISITSPITGTVFHAPDKITLNAIATVSNGSIALVEFYANETKIGESTNAPFGVYWQAPPIGEYSLLAIATDNFGGTAASHPVEITVNALPGIAITNPASGASFTAPGNILISASDSDSNGSVSRVEFYSGAALLGMDTNAPFAFTWTNVAAGTYSLTARAVDDSGGVAVSPAVPVTVRPPGGPASIIAAGASLQSESGPVTGGIDPGETVAVQFNLRNTGGSDTANLVATLQASGGVVSPSSQQTYGVVAAGGPAVGRPFTFTAYGSAGGALTAALQLQDGTNSIGSISYSFVLGASITNANTNTIAIRDAAAADIYPSTISVSGLTGVIERVTLTLSNLSHSAPTHIDALLVGPSGRAVMFMSDAGGTASITNVTLVFDDTASNSLSFASGITNGAFKPVDFLPADNLPSPAPAGPYSTNLSEFRGTTPNGIWSLYIADDTAGSTGRLAGGWSLKLATFGPVNPVADLGVTIADAPDPVGIGFNVGYTMTITNGSAQDVYQVVLTNLVASGLNFVSAIASQGSCSNFSGTVICDIGTLLGGTAATVFLTANATELGAKSFVAEVTSQAWDFNAANNRATNVTTVGETANLAVSMVAQPDPAYVNNTLSYVITISNAGPYSATGVTATNPLPAQLIFGSAVASQGSCAVSNGIVTALLGTLASGATATLTITGTAPASAGFLTNTVFAACAAPIDPVMGNNSASNCTAVVYPAFIIRAVTSELLAESSPPTGGIETGETVSVCFYLRNIGTGSTTNLTATLLSYGGVTSPGGTMSYGALTPNGASVGRTNTFTASASAAGVLTARLQLQEGSIYVGTVDFYFALGQRSTFKTNHAFLIPSYGAATPYPSTIVVSNLPGVITHATATLSNLSHTYLSDLDVLLVGPGGERVILMSDAGGSASVGSLVFTFDNAAAANVPYSEDVSSGTYRPTDYEAAESLPAPAPARPYSTNLSSLNGVNPNGTWSLYVSDDTNGDNGRIDYGWLLDLTTAGIVNPPPPRWDVGSSTNGQRTFILNARVGDTWQIDSSGDLISWTTISTNTFTTNRITFTDLIRTNLNTRFYRAVWRP